MTTEAQVQANRLNAQKSTGPRTAQGKAIVAQNAVKHGFWSERVVIRGEDQEQFESQRNRLLGELAPAGEAEEMLAERIVSLSWRLRRAERLQTEAFDRLLAEPAVDPVSEPHPATGDNGTGLQDATAGSEGSDFGWLVQDFAGPRVLDKLLMYERRIEQSLFKTMAELRQRRLAQERGSSPGLPQRLPGKLRKEGQAVSGGPGHTLSGQDSWPGLAGLGTSQFKLDTLLETPCGITTNDDGAGERLRGTKPIFGREESAVSGPAGEVDDLERDEFAETNPNSVPEGESEGILMATCG